MIEKIEIHYLLWSGKHSAWWRPHDRGYCADEDEAGRFTEAEAIARVVQSSHYMIRELVTCMVADPPDRYEQWLIGPVGIAAGLGHSVAYEPMYVRWRCSICGHSIRKDDEGVLHGIPANDECGVGP